MTEPEIRTRENEHSFLAYSTQVIDRELAIVRAALAEDATLPDARLFQERIHQLERNKALVAELAQADDAAPLETRLDQRIHADQRRTMQLAARVYEQGRYPADYWNADEQREFLTELLAAWRRWNMPDHDGPILNV